MRLEGVFPNTATYNAAISGCSAGGEWKRALRLLREMEANPRGEARPEPLSYSLVLKACARDGQWETSLELLEEMQVWKPLRKGCMESRGGEGGDKRRGQKYWICKGYFSLISSSFGCNLLRVTYHYHKIEI